MLLHWAEFWHDWEHAARLLRLPDELCKYPSFAASQALPAKVTVVPFAAVVAAG